ncbi:MAG: hypothetical protein LDLANPLL_02580 [Turneriella sp.]|nr:hypothetical protein [Turneriella sp.]
MKPRFLSLIVVCVSINCAGARSSIKMTDIKAPVSLSPVIRLKGKIYIKNDNLQVKKTFDQEFSYWGILYSFVPLSDSQAAIAAINTSLADSKADGMINFKVTVKHCGLNGLTGAVLGIIPFMPGCLTARYQGEMVAISGEGK